MNVPKTFFIDVHGQEMMTIKKLFSFLKAHYSIEAQGNWWDMDFEVYQNGKFIGSVGKKWFT